MAGLNALTTEGYAQANGRLQRWNSKGLRPEGLVEAAARRRRYGRPNNRGRCKKTQANGRLQRWNSKGLQEGLVEAAARDSEHFRGWNGFKGFERLKAGKRQA